MIFRCFMRGFQSPADNKIILKNKNNFSNIKTQE